MPDRRTRARLVGVRAACLLALVGAEADAQSMIVIPDLGPGPGGRILRDVLARPHRLVEPDTGWFVVPRGEHITMPLVVLGRTTAISGSVDGDVVVVDGDLHVRAGGQITGRAVAIGGGVYPSAAALTAGGTASIRDNTYEIVREADGYRLIYRSQRAHASPPLLFPGIYGLRLPTYDRVNGASVPFGPTFTFPNGRGEVNAIATYRSDLGKIDPALLGGIQLSRRLRVRVEAQRATFSNDTWIWSDLVNSLSALAFGKDTRNYFRADRGELSLHRLWEGARTQLEPFVGALMERAWSVGPGIGERRGPWSAFGRSDTLGIWRFNPPIADGHIASALTGSTLQWESGGVRLRARTRGEWALDSPADERFTQATSDLFVAFPTFGEQEYALEVHWVATFGDTAPPQRFAYLGGSGTLPFLELLEQGGDQLLLIDQRYSVPLPRLRLGILGIPTLILRHRIGSAGVGELPEFEQMVGAGVMLALLRAELQLDPATRKVRTSVGLSFSR